MSADSNDGSVALGAGAGPVAQSAPDDPSVLAGASGLHPDGSAATVSGAAAVYRAAALV